MNKYDFNRDWGFAKGNYSSDELNDPDLAWDKVCLPHSYNEDDMGPGRENPYIGPAWYRKIFTIGKDLGDNRVFLEFEGVALASKVWVDGSYAGGRDGGFLGFRLDITESLNRELAQHQVHVLADNSYNPAFPPPLHTDWERYGGIYRPVHLLKGDPCHIGYKGVKISTPDVTSERACLETRTRVGCKSLSGGSCRLTQILIDPQGQRVDEISSDFELGYYETRDISLDFDPIVKPTLWHTDSPRLYTLLTRLSKNDRVLEERREKVGFRFVSFDPDKGFSLNGRSMKLRGCNDHQEFGGMAHACPERYHRFSASLMKEMGLNFMRTSHYPRNEMFLQACDELGIMVMEEQPLWHGSMRSALGEQFVANCVRMAAELVEHHGNHPSVIAWNVGNEVLLGPKWERGSAHAEPKDERRKAWNIPPGEYNYIKRLIASVHRAFKEADPVRPVSHIIGGCWKRNEEAFITEISDLTGYNGGTFNIRNYRDEETGRTYPFLIDYLREKHPARKPVMTEGIINDNALIQDRSNRAEWEREYKAWETNADYWNAIYERDWFPGGSMWGFSEYYANGLIRGMGAVDVFRLPLELFYFYKAMWNEDPSVHILGHWERERPRDWDNSVIVFSNAAETELFLNGRSLGRGESMKERWPGLPHAPVIFRNISYEPGILEARALGMDETVTDRRETAGEPVRLSVSSLSPSLKADGMDMAFIDIVLVDDADRRCYTKSAEVMLEAEGPGLIKGENPLILQGGCGRFALRSTGESGIITVTAGNEGLNPGSFVLEAEDFARPGETLTL